MELVFSLLAGLIITVALQLLLTSLGAALGLTVLRIAPPSETEPPQDASSSSNFSLPITHLVGFSVALSLTTVLACSSLAITEFSQISEPRRGLVFGIILWSTYWLLLIWLSSTTITSIANSMIGAAAGGSKRLISVLQAAMKAEPEPDDSEVLQELVSEVSDLSQQQSHLAEQLNHQRESLLQDIRVHLTAESLPSIEKRQLTPSVTPAADESNPPVPISSSISADGILPSLKTALSDAVSQFDLPRWQDLLKKGINQWDWSDWDVETLWHQLQSLKSQDSSSLLHDAILRDAESYIRSAPTWAFQSALLEEEFHERLYDPDADPQEINTQLAQLSHTRLLNWLQARDDLPTDQLETFADDLATIRDRVVQIVSSPSPSPIDAAAFPEIQKKLVSYCRYTNRNALTREGIAEKVQALLEAYPDRSVPVIRQALDLQRIKMTLTKRRGVTKAQVKQLIDSLKSAWSQHRRDAPADKSSLLPTLHGALAQRLESFELKQVSLEDLKPLVTECLDLLDGQPLSLADWSKLGQQLQISPAVQTELLLWLRTKGVELAKLPRPWIIRTLQSSQDLYRYLNHQLVHYLRHQDKSALNPEQMTQDFSQVMQSTLRSLPHLEDLTDLSIALDPNQLDLWKQALEQRQDLTEGEINHILSWGKSSWNQAIQSAEETLHSLWTAVSESIPTLDVPLEASTEALSTVRQRLGEPLESIQSTIEQQADHIGTELQRQADAAQQQVKIAAWWLFGSLLLSGIGTAAAGWIAVIY